MKIINQPQFMDQLNNTLKQKGLLVEDQRPQIGIWYYLWLKPSWKLWHWSTPADSTEMYTHQKVWQHIVPDIIGKHYVLEQGRINVLSELWACMPRGRIDKFGEIFKICHGDDFPDNDKDIAIKTLVGMFNLTHFALDNKVQDVKTSHESMNASHQKKAQEILGLIPYTASS